VPVAQPQRTRLRAGQGLGRTPQPRASALKSVREARGSPASRVRPRPAPLLVRAAKNAAFLVNAALHSSGGPVPASPRSSLCSSRLRANEKPALALRTKPAIKRPRKSPKNHKGHAPAGRAARPWPSAPRSAAFSPQCVARRSRALRVARGPLPLVAPDSACGWTAMKTQRGPVCSGCGRPVSRLHISVQSPSVRPGHPHSWVFCGLLCLHGWVATQRGYASAWPAARPLTPP
jgi:hypothetical protein